MIPKNYLRIILLVAIVLLTILLWYRSRTKPIIPEQPSSPSTKSTPTTPPQAKVIGDETLSRPPLKIGPRSLYGDLPEGIKSVDALPLANKPGPWKRALEAQIKRQGGKTLKSADIEHQESYIIIDGGAGRYVERVIVKVKGVKGETNSFFAEVDSETGYVMKTWGSIIQERPTHSH